MGNSFPVPPAVGGFVHTCLPVHSPVNKNPINQEKQSQYQNCNSENRGQYGVRIRQPSGECTTHDPITPSVCWFELVSGSEPSQPSSKYSAMVLSSFRMPVPNSTMNTRTMTKTAPSTNSIAPSTLLMSSGTPIIPCPPLLSHTSKLSALVLFRHAL